MKKNIPNIKNQLKRQGCCAVGAELSDRRCGKAGGDKV